MMKNKVRKISKQYHPSFVQKVIITNTWSEEDDGNDVKAFGLTVYLRNRKCPAFYIYGTVNGCVAHYVHYKKTRIIYRGLLETL